MATKKQIQEAAAANKKWLIAKQKKHVKMVESSIKTLQGNILNSLKELKTTPTGKLSSLNVNSQLLQKTHKSIIQSFGSTFNASTKKIINDFKTAKAQIGKNFKIVDEIADFTKVDDIMMETLRDGSYQRYLSLGRDAQSRVVQSMYDQVIAGGQFSDLVNTINGALVGSAAKGVTGYSLAQYSRLYANDMIMNYHNDVMMKKATDLGMTNMQYIGTIMDSTRKFCGQRVGNTYSIKVINSWKQKWKGKSGPALTHRGGYNCRHHWQPVRKEWLTEKEQSMYGKLNKLDAKGNVIGAYKPVVKPKPIIKKEIPSVIGKEIIPAAPSHDFIKSELVTLKKSKKYIGVQNDVVSLEKQIKVEGTKRDKILAGVQPQIDKINKAARQDPDFFKKSRPKVNLLQKPFYDQSRVVGKLMYDQNTAKKLLTRMESDVVLKSIKPPKGGTIKTSIAGNLTARQEKAIKKGVTQMENLLHPKVIKEMPHIDITYQKGIRSNYTQGGATTFGRRNSTVRLGETNTPTIIHEYGHGLEFNTKGRMNKSLQFLQKRAAGSNPTRIYKGSDEYGWKDGFFDHYCGKEYSFKSTEIVSMGLEQMYRKPYTFFKQDPEYFDYILKVMWGVK